MAERVLLGNIKGQKGDKGVKGDKGDPGSIVNTNANLIPYHPSKWERGAFFLSDGSKTDSANNMRTIKTLPVIKGNDYTFSDSSIYVSSMSHMYIVEWENGTYIGRLTINRGESLTFTARGNEIKIALMSLDGFSVSDNLLRYDNRYAFKLEEGSIATPLIHENTRQWYKIHELEDRINKL